MNERELSIIETIGDVIRETASNLREEFSKSLDAQRLSLEEQIKSLSVEIQGSAPDIDALAVKVAALIPTPDLPELPDFTALLQTAVDALPVPRDGKSVTPEEIRPMVQELVGQAVSEIPIPRDGKDYDPEALAQAVDDAVSRIPVPEDGKSVTIDDVTPVLQQMVDDAVSAIPTPRDGKDYDPVILQQAVLDAVSGIPVPADGKSVTVEDITPILKSLVEEAMPELPDVQGMVDKAVAALPAAEPAVPGKDGDDGRDALQLEILPGIDEATSYQRGTYATHNGGLWRSFQKTQGMYGWECIVDGIASVDVGQDGERNFTVSVLRAGGHSDRKTFSVPVMLYRGVFKIGETYQPGDTVTWGGSLWHCDACSSDKPGEIGSKGWTLAAKRGRDGRDKHD